MEELQHFGIKGMKWGARKAATAAGSARVTIQEQSANILRRDAGIVATRALLKNYGHQALPVAKTAVKGGVGLLRYSGRVAKGAGTAVRLLGATARVTSKFGKAYVRGAVAIAKAAR